MTWTWSPSVDGIKYYRYQLNGENNNNWTVVDASVYVMGGVETTAMRERSGAVMFFRNLDVPMHSVVINAGVGGTYNITSSLSVGLESLWYHQVNGYRDSIGARLVTGMSF